MKPKIQLMLDSGAYSAWTQKKEVNLSEYTDFVKENPQHIAHTVNLDMINPGKPEEAAAAGWDNLCYMKEKGVDAIPVYHARENLKWFDKMLDTCTYIGISGTSLVSPTEHLAFYDLAWHYGTDSSGYPLAKYHAFGDTAPYSLLTYPWHSVTGDGLVLIRQAGRVRIESLEELFWSSPEPVEFITRSGSTKKRRLLDTSTLIPVNGLCIWAPVDYIFKHDNCSKVYQVRTRRGKRVKLTSDHGVFVSKFDGDLDGKATITEQLEVRKSKVVSSQPFLSSLRHDILSGVTINLEIAAYKPGRKSDTYKKSVPYFVTFTEKLCEYLGLWLADGSCSDTVSVSAANDEECKSLLEKIASDYERDFLVDKNGVDGSIHSNLLAQITRALFEKEVYESHTKEVPYWVFQLSQENLEAFLRGYFSGDGSAESDSVNMTTTSPKLRHAIYYLLTALGIRCICSEEDAHSSKFSNGKVYKCRHTYKLQVLDKESLQIFNSRVRFLQGRKNKKITDVILNKSDAPGRGIRDPRINEVELVRVEELTELEEQVRTVYDLSVHRYEKFAVNGLVVHNSADSATWMIQAGRAGAVKLAGKSYNIRSKKVRDNNFIYLGMPEVQYQSWLQVSEELGLKGDKVLTVETTASQLAMIRSYMVASDILKLRDRAVACDRFKKPPTLISSKKQTGALTGKQRLHPPNIYFVISPSAWYFNFPVIRALNIKNILVSYFYVKNEKPVFWNDRLLPFIYDPVDFCERDEKTKRFWDKLQEVLLHPVEENNVTGNVGASAESTITTAHQESTQP